MLEKHVLFFASLPVHAVDLQTCQVIESKNLAGFKERVPNSTLKSGIIVIKVPTKRCS